MFFCVNEMISDLATYADLFSLFIMHVDPEVHLVAFAAGWVGLPAKDAMYIPDLPEKDRSEVCSEIIFNAPKLHYEKADFWSITTHSPDG